MSRREGVLDLPVGPEAALGACRAAIGEMGWHLISQDADRIEAREDPVRLCCHQSPAQSELRVSAAEHGSTVAIETKVPGFGPVCSAQADERQKSLVRRLHKHAVGPAGRPR